MATNANIEQSIHDTLFDGLNENTRRDPDNRHGKRWVNERVARAAAEHLNVNVARTFAENDLSNLNVEVDDNWAAQLGYQDKAELAQAFLTLANNGGLNYSVGSKQGAAPGTHVRFTGVKRESNAPGSIITACKKAYICDLRHCVTALGNAAGNAARTILLALLDSKTELINMLRENIALITNKQRRASDNYNLIGRGFKAAGFTEQQIKALPMRMLLTINNRMLPSADHAGRSDRKRALRDACGFSQDQVDDETLRDVKITRHNGFGLPVDEFMREATAIEIYEAIERAQQNGTNALNTNRDVVRMVVNNPNSSVNRVIKIVRERPDGTIRTNEEIARLRFCHVDELDPAFLQKLGNPERVKRQKLRAAARNERRRQERQERAQHA